MNKFLTVLSCLLSFLFLSLRAHAYEEVWGTLALRHPINDEQQVMGEWRRRDSENLVFSGKSSDIFRLSLNTKFKGFSYMAGLSYAEFETNPSHEFRLHQFLSIKLLNGKYASMVTRIGTEHRDFSSDANIYHRVRAKLQFNTLLQHRFGPSIYNEAFFALNGGDRFATGFNENRTGFGVRSTFRKFEIYAFHTFVHLTFPVGDAHQEWLQFQLIFDI